MPQHLPPDTQRVKSWLESHGFNPDIRFLDQSTGTFQEAADALGVPIGQIAKSLVFYKVTTQEPLLILVSGTNRVDKTKVGEFLGCKIKTAGPEFVLEKTGFPVGGVPPVSHKTPLKTLIDRDVMQYETIYAAAGTDHTLFPISPQQLVKLTKAVITTIC
jgi:prolyl-tRNA editing enzyme YbaK/EbsC (Cys-tRNA(Pro) deacylase)